MRMNGNAKRLFFLLSSSYFIVGEGQRVAKFFPFSFQVFVASHFYTTFILLVVSVAGEMKNTSSLFCSVLSWMWKVGNKVCSSVYTTRYYGKMMNLLDIPASLYDTQIWMCFTTASYSTDVVKLVYTVLKNQAKKSHSKLQAKRATLYILSGQKWMVHFDEFLKTWRSKRRLFMGIFNQHATVALVILHNNDEEESCETQQKEGLYFKQRRIAFVMPIRKWTKTQQNDIYLPLLHGSPALNAISGGIVPQR